MSAPVSVVFSAVAQLVSSFHLISLASANPTVVKAAPGFLTSLYLSNASAAAKFVKLYDKATAPVVGTDVPICTILVPIGGSIFQDMTSGYKFNNGIAFAITGLIADNDATAVAVGDVAVNGQYC